MESEFVVFDADGKEIDWVDPVVEVNKLDEPGWYLVDNGSHEYEVHVPEGGWCDIRAKSPSGSGGGSLSRRPTERRTTMTDEKTRALIAEAEALIASRGPDRRDSRLIRRLADALSALTVPDGDARERIARILHPGYGQDSFTAENCASCRLAENDADAILADGFSRTTSPDVATEATKQVEEDRAYLYQLSLKLGQERDAALAVIERVRAIHAPEVLGVHEGHGEEVWCPTCQHHYPCPTIAALDGAPEPEWEYNTQAENGFLYSETTQEDAQLSAEMSRRVHDYPGSTTTRLIRHVVRRRKAGPWEPLPEEGNVR